VGIPWWGLVLVGILLGAAVRVGVGGRKWKKLGLGLYFASWLAFSSAIYTSGLLNGSAAWLRLIVAIVVGLIAPIAALLAWSAVLSSFARPFGDEHSRQALDQTLREKGIAVDSPFPLCDDTGHLICKNCGVAYDTATLDAARAQFKGPEMTVSITSYCTRCSKVSMFTALEIKKGR
jgi:hypothetical protein